MESLVELAQSLSEIFSGPSPTVEILPAIASHLGMFGITGVENAIKHLLASNQLESVARQSYLHGNGFYKIILHTDNIVTLRLHVWMPGCDAQENLHSHRWPLVSTVLTGTLESEVWIDSARSSSRSYDEYLYLGKNEPLRRVGEARVELSEMHVVRAPDTYIMMPHELHRVVGDRRSMTSTLMCRSVDCKSWARNIVVNTTIPDIAPRYMSTGDLKELLVTYLACFR